MTAKARRRKFPTWAKLACLALLAIAAGCGDDDEGGAGPEPLEAKAVTAQELKDFASSLDQPVYWAGEEEGRQYELTVTEEGQIFIRYLAPDTPIGSEKHIALTISTYPVDDAHSILEDSVEETGAETATAPNEGLVVTYASDPQSAYLAYPDSDYQVEVFDPQEGGALELATSERIEPLE